MEGELIILIIDEIYQSSAKEGHIAYQDLEL